MWLSEKATKYFREVNIAKSRKKLQPCISENIKCYIFLKSSEQLWLKLKGFKVFQGGWPCQFWKEASSLFLLKPQVLYIFEILSAIVTQSDGYQVSVTRFQLTLDSGLLLESQARLGTGFKFQLTLDALNVLINTLDYYLSLNQYLWLK